MDFIEKLFKKIPFIYYVNGDYYALGSLTCKRCGEKYVTLPVHYKRFIDNLDEELTQLEAWKLFHKVEMDADFVREMEGKCIKPEEEFLKFEFSEEEVKEIDAQLERWVDFFKKYNLKEYTR